MKAVELTLDKRCWRRKMNYILIAIVLTGFKSPVDQQPITAEFTTKVACETAASLVSEKFHMSTVCVAKGE